MNHAVPEPTMLDFRGSAIGADLKERCSVPDRHPAPICRAEKLLAIRLRRPDPAAASQFFVDFGLAVHEQQADYVMLRGAADTTASVLIERGPVAFVGLTLAIASEDDLARLARAHGQDISAADLGRPGRCVTLRDPDGLRVEALSEYACLDQRKVPQTPAENQVGDTPRINQPVRVDLNHPCIVNKIGHTAIGVRRIGDSIGWYAQNFGLIVSDFQLLADDPIPVVAFLRCDRGDHPADHHTLAIASGVDLGHMHTAFEVNGLDSVASGGEFLGSRGYRRSWGIGRHLLGSQVFDYWRDPEGAMFEHYTDGDRFDNTVPAGYHLFSGRALYQWGPPVSADMAGKQPSRERLQTLISRLRSDDDLTFKRLISLVRAG